MITVESQPESHSCIANARPVVERQDPMSKEHVISGAMRDNGVEVEAECQKCGCSVTLEYQFVEAEY